MKALTMRVPLQFLNGAKWRVIITQHFKIIFGPACHLDYHIDCSGFDLFFNVVGEQITINMQILNRFFIKKIEKLTYFRTVKYQENMTEIKALESCFELIGTA